MREDMAKVLTERPRRGPHIKTQKGERKRLQRDPDGLPSRESMSRKRKPIHREFSDLIGPLRGLIKKNVGRPWNKVYSEICEHISPGNQVQNHILQHLKWEVELDVEMVGKVPHDKTTHRYRRDTACRSKYYVNPNTGLLCLNKYYESYRYRRRKEIPDYIKIDDTHQARMFGGIWYELTLKPLPPNIKGGPLFINDILMGSFHSRYDYARTYGQESYCVEKRQLGKKEIRRIIPQAVALGIVEVESQLPNIMR